MKFEFAGISFDFYEKNLNNDYLPLVKFGNTSVSTKEVKTHIDNIIKFIKNVVEAYSIFDERYKKYSTALNFLVSIKGIFSAKTPEKLTEESAKITIDVIKEIALMQPIDDFQKKAIESAAFITKIAIEKVGEL